MCFRLHSLSNKTFLQNTKSIGINFINTDDHHGRTEWHTSNMFLKKMDETLLMSISMC